jgi:hypothetical protein
MPVTTFRAAGSSTVETMSSAKRRPISVRRPRRTRGTAASGSNGRSMAARNSRCFEPKKWVTSAGSTAASAAIERTVVRS